LWIIWIFHISTPDYHIKSPRLKLKRKEGDLKKSFHRRGAKGAKGGRLIKLIKLIGSKAGKLKSLNAEESLAEGD